MRLLHILATALAACHTATALPELTGTYENCKQLGDTLHLRYEVDTTTRRLSGALEAAFPAGSTGKWVGFGPNTDGSGMVGASVAIGVVDNAGTPTAIDYLLGSQSQCASDGSGVCPTGSTDETVTTVGGGRDGNVMTVEFTLQLADAVSASTPLIWGTGPVLAFTDGDQTRPVVGKHAVADRGVASFDLFAPDASDDCIAFTADQLAPRDDGQDGDDERRIEDETVFSVSIQPSIDYPLPPGWGIDYWINDVEAPVLVLRRGVPVLFLVSAPAAHPVYITDSIEGGTAADGSLNGQVHGGGSDVFGTEDGDGGVRPFRLEWMPTDEMPDVLYYQCTRHKRLGWRIELVGKEDEGDLEAAAGRLSFSPSAILAVYLTHAVAASLLLAVG